jgi:hypothetical protein
MLSGVEPDAVVTSSAPPAWDVENRTSAQRPWAPGGVTAVNDLPPSVVRSNTPPVPVASTAAERLVGATVAVAVSAAGTTTGAQSWPPSVLRRTAGADPPQTAHTAVADAAATSALAPGHGAVRFTKCPPLSEDDHRRAPPAADALGTAAIHTVAPDADMLTVGPTEVKGDGRTLQRPVEVPNRRRTR